MHSVWWCTQKYSQGYLLLLIAIFCAKYLYRSTAYDMVMLASTNSIIFTKGSCSSGVWNNRHGVFCIVLHCILALTNNSTDDEHTLSSVSYLRSLKECWPIAYDQLLKICISTYMVLISYYHHHIRLLQKLDPSKSGCQ